MSRTVQLVAKRLWPGWHNKGLAAALGVPRSTARSWSVGFRRMPEKRLLQLEAYLRDEAAVRVGLADQVAFAAKQEAQRFKPRSGFWILRDWHGTGFEHDKRNRWHGPPQLPG